MAREIDAEKYMELLKEQYLHNKSMGNSQAARAWQGAMQLLYDMPTLTPPNEPLTLDELWEMKDKPAYLNVFDPLLESGWHIIKAVTEDKIIFRGWQTVYVHIDGMGIDYNLYRRPPEREEGHKMSTEYPCIYFEKDGVCRKLSSDTDFQCCVMGPCPEQKLSNADRIRAMSDEELSDIFLRADFCKCCEHEKDGACNYICAYPNIPLYDGCKQAALTWMKQPAEEDT